MTSISSSSGNGIGNVLQRQETYGQRQNVGLTDRNTATERNSSFAKVQQTITQNHGYDARKSTQEALTNNSKIINTRADQRGTVVDISV